MAPVEAFVTGIKIFGWQKVCLITWLFPSEAFDRLIFNGSKVTLYSCILDTLIFTVQRSHWSLDQLSKRASIAWFNFAADFSPRPREEWMIQILKSKVAAYILYNLSSHTWYRLKGLLITVFGFTDHCFLVPKYTRTNTNKMTVTRMGSATVKIRCFPSRFSRRLKRRSSFDSFFTGPRNLRTMTKICN